MPATFSDANAEPASLLTALVYPQNTYPAAAFEALVAACRGRSLSLAGVLQHVVGAAPERRCDVELEDLATGHRRPSSRIAERARPGAGLDEGALVEVAARIEKSLATGPDILVLNKFGKTECEGGGVLDLIGRAVEREIRVVIGVPQDNLLAWRGCAGGLAVEFSAAPADIERWAERQRRAGRVA